MLDIKFVRENLDAVETAMKNRKADFDKERFSNLDTSRRELIGKEEALQAALKGACLVPLRIMDVCCAVLVEASFMAQNGSKLAVSDAGASALLACAAVKAASLNIFINTNTMANKELAADLEKQADTLIAQAEEHEKFISTMVMGAIRK